MKVIYQISSEITGEVILKRRKIAKALRWWLRENGFKCSCSHVYRNSLERSEINRY
ncbi:MAG: hypothetical protein JXR66_12255 [Bacteroidales bacterium]|nr:hypothetical protein [Bacteroidales bacterium]